MNKFSIATLFFALLHSILFAQVPKNVEFIGQYVYPVDSGVSTRYTLNDIWGYASPDGHEYALVGTLQGLSIVDLEDPANPEEIHFVPGDTSIWRDIKTYEDIAYVVNEQGGGLTLVDLSELPERIQVKDTFFVTDTVIRMDTLILNDTLENGSILLDTVATVDTLYRRVRTAHNLYQDEGVLYMAGINQLRGGILMLDLTEDPWNPNRVGAYSEQYVHDVYVRDGVAYTAEINARRFRIVDVSDKQAPTVLGTRSYPGAFTHNTWLNDAGTVCFTTDERAGAFIRAWDIQDPENIEELDRIRSSLSKGRATPHNVHVKDDFLISSYYADGIHIVDAHRPHNLVEVGYYDTSPDSLGGFGGSWGAYPFLPSGLILASDRAEGLVVLRPTLKRASYLEGTVQDGFTEKPLAQARISVVSPEGVSVVSNPDGTFATGIVDSGSFPIIVEHPGYLSDTLDLLMSPGEVSSVDIQLFPELSNLIAVKTLDMATGQSLEQVALRFRDSTDQLSFQVETDSLGQYQDTLIAANYDLFIGKWGYQTLKIPANLLDSNLDTITVYLSPAYYDDFSLDFGWKGTGKRLSGIWERAIPSPTLLGDVLLNPGTDDPTDLDEYAYVTDNEGIFFNDADVDGPTITLSSPKMLLSPSQSPIIRFSYWLTAIESNFNFIPAKDSLTVFIHQGADSIEVLSIGGPFQETWGQAEFFPGNFLSLEDSVWVSFAIGDPEPADFIEAGIDHFRVVTEGDITSYEPEIVPKIRIFPNPIREYFHLELPHASSGKWKLIDFQGRKVQEGIISSLSPTTLIPFPYPKGIYFVSIQLDDFPDIWEKLVK